MYNYDYDEDTAGYDYENDGGESEARKKWAHDELEEYSQWDKDAFIESVRKHNQKYKMHAHIETIYEVPKLIY
jgi:hypothetical protein